MIIIDHHHLSSSLIIVIDHHHHHPQFLLQYSSLNISVLRYVFFSNIEKKQNTEHLKGSISGW